MSSQGASFNEDLAVLALLLMRERGDRVVVTQQQIWEAREFMRNHDTQVVTYEESMLRRNVVVEFRHKSNRVLAGEEVV